MNKVLVIPYLCRYNIIFSVYILCYRYLLSVVYNNNNNNIYLKSNMQ